MPFRPDPAFQRQVFEETDAFDNAARKVAERAVANVHGAFMPRKGYRGIEVQGRGPDVTVVNTRYGAHLQEWGSRRNPAQAPLRRAVRQAGLHLQEE